MRYFHRDQSFGLLLSLLFLTSLAVAGHAQDAPEAIELRSQGGTPLPGDAVLELRPREDRPDYEPLTSKIHELLAERQINTADRGGIILRFGYQITGASTSRRNPNISITGRTGIGGSTDMQMKMKVLRHETSGPRRKADGSASDLIMTFELYRPGSPPLWSATLRGPDNQYNRESMLIEMIEIAILNIGKTKSELIQIEN